MNGVKVQRSKGRLQKCYIFLETNSSLVPEILWNVHMLQRYEKFGCKISLKVNFSHSCLALFPDNLGTVIEGHDDGFHKGINKIKQSK